MTKLKWGLLATGRIAHAFAKGVLHSDYGEISAVASRSLASAQTFAQDYKIPQAYGSYESLLQDPDVEAVYISTPHPMHAEWIIKCAQAGKHILCEKPLTLNYTEALQAAEAASQHNVLLMEAFMFRCHPLILKLKELIAQSVIGEVRLIKATFSFQCDLKPESRLINKSLGGGGILDVGCYTTTLSRLIAGVAADLPFADPIKFFGTASLLENGVDGWAAATLQFPKNILAQVSCGCQLNQNNGIEIFGSTGHIRIPHCWVPAIEGGSSTIILQHQNEPEQEIIVETAKWLYSFEADAFARALSAGLRSVPEVPIEDTLGNMKTLDLWLQQAGVHYT